MSQVVFSQVDVVRDDSGLMFHDDCARNKPSMIKSKVRYSGVVSGDFDFNRDPKPVSAMFNGNVYRIEPILFRPKSNRIEFEYVEVSNASNKR